MLASMSPDDGSVPDGKDGRQRPRIANLTVDEVALTDGLKATGPCLGSEHFTEATSLDAEGGVQLAVRVGDGLGAGEQLVEEHGPLLRRALVDEDHLRVVGIGFNSVGELVDQLAVEQSTKVTKKDQERVVGIDQLVESFAFQMVAIDWKLERVVVNRFHRWVMTAGRRARIVRFCYRLC